MIRLSGGAGAALVCVVLFAAPAARADTRVVLFIVDSVSAELLYGMLDSGDLPNLAAAVDRSGARVDEAIAPFPTISFYAHTCILTGCWADRHGITAIRWYDRSSNRNRSYAGVGAELIDDDIDPSVKTIFEHLEDLNTVSIGSVVHRGADEYVPPWLPPDGLRMKALQRRFQKKNPPDVSVVVLTGLDWPAHRYGPKSEWVRIGLRKLDQDMGRFFKLLKKRGLDKNTYIFFTADHGHAPVRGRIDLYSLFTSLGFDLLDKFLYTARTEGWTDYDAVMWMAGVGYAFLYLPHRTDTEMSWSRRPDESELLSYPTAGGRRVNLIDELTRRPQIAFIVIRDPLSGKVSAFSNAGRLEVEHDLGEYPDAAVQIPRLMAAPRAPDILIVPRDGYETAWSWHRGRHGGYTRQEMIVPLLAIGPNIVRRRIPRARTIDLLPSILNLLGRYHRPDDFDGTPIELFSSAPSR